MIVSSAFRQPVGLTAVALCSLAMVALATPASARPHHGASRHFHAHRSHHVKTYHGHRHHAGRGRYAVDARAESSPSQSFGGFGGSDVVSEARRYIGGNPTGRSRLWCARFMNFVLQRSGHKGTGSDMARSFAGYGQRISGPQVGAHRGHEPPWRWSCRHRQRHRCQRQSDCDLRQSRSPRRRIDLLARANLRLRHADELTISILSPGAMLPPVITSA